jgi:predicted dehydrogenase
VAVIGGGFGAAVHVPALRAHPGVRITAVSDSGSGRARAHMHEDMSYVQGWRGVLERQDVDAVTVAVPPAAQHDIVAAALRSGRHVFCEKPFGMCAQDARALRQLASSSGKVVGVDFQFRYEPAIAALREALKAGRIGEIRSVDFRWVTSGRAKTDVPWSWQNDAAAGGGVIAGFFSHVADLLTWLTDRQARAVSARSAIVVPERLDNRGARRRVTAEDSVSAFVEFEGDLLATCQVTNCQPGGTGMRIELRGEGGILAMSHKPPYTREDCRLTLYEADSRPRALALPAAGQATGDSRTYAVSRCIGAFVDAVAGRREHDLPDADDALRAQATLEAVRRSCETGARMEIHRIER